MNLKEKIKSLLQQGALYRSQGLLTEAIARFEEAVTVLQGQQVKNKETVIQGIQAKIRDTRAELEKFEAAPVTPEVSAKIQDLIKQQFAFGDNQDQAALEGALALAKFGQFNRALEEFQQMVATDAIRVEAAKNVIRCHMALSSVSQAVDQYDQWMADDRFTPDQIHKIRVFFQDTLERAGKNRVLPGGEPDTDIGRATIDMPPGDEDEARAPATRGRLSDIEIPEIHDEEILDINSIGFEVAGGPDKGKTVELNVSFQNGDLISLLIPGGDTEIINYLQANRTLQDVQFYSPMAIFSGSGQVRSQTKIESGPRRGDFNIDIKVICS